MNRTGDRRYLVLFDSIHYVLAFERQLKRGGIEHDVVPLPRELSSDCGSAIEFREQVLEEVRRMLNMPSAEWRQLYRERDDRFELIDERVKKRDG